MNNPINWSYINQAVAYYRGLGFKYVEAPWIVSPDSIGVTLPVGRRHFTCNDGGLVGSAEQGFIELMRNGLLSEPDRADGLYVAAGPCFRDDDVDLLHQKTFFKVELIRILGLPTGQHEAQYLVKNMAKMAVEFFEDVLGEEVVIVETAEGLDIELNDVEIGSYGYREAFGKSWVYGTGLAEPRFSMVSQGRHLG